VHLAECVYFALHKSANFSETWELILVDYITECSNLNYGMTYKQIHRLAYDYGRLQCKFPVAGLITRLQGLIGYRALWKDTRTLRFTSPKVQVSSGPRHQVKQT
jgi:hypothetical protein